MSLEREIGELTATVAGLREDLRAHREEERRWQQVLDARLDIYGKRLRVLERWRDGIAGAAILLGILWAALRSLWNGRG